MLVGLPFSPADKQLTEERIRIRKLFHTYNSSRPATSPSGEEAKDIQGTIRRELLKKMFPLKEGQEEKIEIEPPFWWYVNLACETSTIE